MMTGVVRGSCHHDCPDTCVWEVTVEAGRAVKLRGNNEHPTTRGQLCPKVNHFLDRVYHPDRLLTPLRRSGPKGSAQFEPISWDEAFDEVATRFNQLIETVGPQSILPYSLDGTQGVIQKGIMAERFFATIGASDVRRDLCGVTAWLGAAEVSGQPFGIDPEDLRQAKTIILWGTNTQLTNRHLWPTITEARRAGATVAVIDPIRTSTADKADEFYQIRPGTDVALVLAMIAVADRDDLLDPDWLASSTSGWAELRKSAHALPLAEAAAITGISVERIEHLTHTYLRRQPAAIRVLVGPEHREQGRQIMRAIALLPAVTGAWRQVGGGLARSTQIYFETALNHQAEPANTTLSPPGPRRQFNMAELGHTLTRSELDPPIAALMVHNSNPAVICPDQNAVLAGLRRPDLFTVVVEQFMTDTARYADIVLPATTQIEHLDLGIAWGHLYLSLNQPAIEPLGQALSNTEIFRRLANRMGLDEPSLQDDDETLIRQLLESDHPWLDGISYERLVSHTWARLNIAPGHRPNVDTPPATPDGRLTLGPLSYSPATEGPDAKGDRFARYPLVLLSRKQHPEFLNANYGGSARHLPRRGEPTLEIHPIDAATRGIVPGDLVTVHNARGSLTLAATISDVVQPGVVATPFGWWHRHTPDRRGVNVLTNPATPGDGIGSAAFHDTLVQVERV
ncbi:MAG: molybdopterin-dependent oxidoreductase [Actinomycetia bacterium]|nr:molybdopterin-dependent oxidoreductase [Actinomycetes bacterium]